MLRRSKYKRQSFFPLLDLPEELLVKSCSFLSAHDAVSLSRTCRNLHSQFHLALLSPIPVFERLGWMGHPTSGEQRQKSIRLGTEMLERHVQAVRFEFIWRDQGWGHQKGQVWIIAKSIKDDKTHKDESNFNGGRIVYESGVAPHANATEVVWFTPIPGEEYHLWYKVGSGGGHSLHLENGKLQVFVRDDANWNIRTNYSGLLQADLIPIVKDIPTLYPRMLMTLIESLIRQQEQGENVDAQVVDLLRQYHLSTSTPGLRVILDIMRDAQVCARKNSESLPLPAPVRAPAHVFAMGQPPDAPPHHRHIRLGRMIRLDRQPPLHAGGGNPPGGQNEEG
ncbi:hypothetical protein MPSEU_000057500 [Mayamaea pseudoterrestris]|nr:hypothetical protein MPSEU_000057500 [Mayamaea pseudoterrestris]